MNFKICILSVTCLILLSSHKQLSEINSKIKDHSSDDVVTRMPYVIDTFNLTNNNKMGDRLSSSTYFPYYLGEFKDSIKVNYFLIDEPNGYEEYLPGNMINFVESAMHDSAQIDIFIDTAQLIRNVDVVNKAESVISYNAHPVLVKNLNSQQVHIGSYGYIGLVTEAIGLDGKWHNIDYTYADGCSVKSDDIILPANHIAISSIIVYKGEFNTLIRLRLGNNISNSIMGQINLSQFEY